mgnify:CR=1 FL=1
MGYGQSNGHPLLGGMLIDFKYSPPKITKQDNKTNFYVSCASCSDSLGNFLFYTNGIEIRDITRDKMQNGDSINATSNFWQQWKTDGYAAITPMYSIPFPEHSNQYFLFHQAIRYGIAPSGSNSIEFPLMYTLIDMNQNNGLGRVVLKNQMMVSDSAISTAMVKHGNGRDWWLITGVQSDPVQLVYLINESGINGPFKQGYGPPFLRGESLGFSTFSPDGATYIRVSERAGLRVFDFDRCNGQLSNLRVIPFEDGFRSFSALYSADSRFLYLSFYDKMVVMDMQSDDPVLSLDTLCYYDGFATPVPFDTGFLTGQLHEDGKIYYATTNGTLALHVIHHPEMPGLAADVQQHGIKLPLYNAETMCRFPNYRLGKWAGSPCDTMHQKDPHPPGFHDEPYTPQKEPDAHVWRVLSPLRGKGGAEVGWPSMQEMILNGGKAWRRRE